MGKKQNFFLHHILLIYTSTYVLKKALKKNVTFIYFNSFKIKNNKQATIRGTRFQIAFPWLNFTICYMYKHL